MSKKLQPEQWFVIYDGTYTHLSNDPDDESQADDKYGSFSEAKKAVVEYCSDRANDFRYAAKHARRIRKADFLLLVLTLIFSIGCARPGSTSPEAPASSATVLDDWGMYYKLPIDFTTFKLNAPNTLEWTVNDEGGPFVTCRLTVTIDGTAQAGRIRMYDGTQLWIRPMAGTTLCTDYQMNHSYLATDKGLVVDSGPTGGGFLLTRGM